MHRIALALPLVVTLFAPFGCATRPDPSPPAPEVYAVALQVPTPANLPVCGAALSGTTAFVAAPAGLWTCQRTTWLPIPCTTLLAGAVAYASATNTLFACSSGQWAPVALPGGSTGPQGDPGPSGAAGATSRIVVGPEPSGANCATGGVRVDVGIDTDGNGALDASEVQQTAYVCNGAPGAPTTDPDAGPGGTDGGSAGSDAGGSPCSTVDCSNNSSGHACLVTGTCGCNSPSDCPTGTACNTTTHVCTPSCSGPAQCNGGCCQAGVCVGGEANDACGTGGALCRNCPPDRSVCSDGVCVACTPSCQGASCGAPDGCGGTCGSGALCCGGIICPDLGGIAARCCAAADQCGVDVGGSCVPDSA